MFVLKNAARQLMSSALLFAVLLLCSGLTEARPTFPKIFKAQYPELAKAEKINCTLCHPKEDNKKKKFRNNYGWALKKALEHKENEKDKDKIKAAIVKIENEKSHVDGKTFGDLIKENKLPGDEEKVDEEAEKKKDEEVKGK